MFGRSEVSESGPVAGNSLAMARADGRSTRASRAETCLAGVLFVLLAGFVRQAECIAQECLGLFLLAELVPPVAHFGHLRISGDRVPWGMESSIAALA